MVFGRRLLAISCSELYLLWRAAALLAHRVQYVAGLLRRRHANVLAVLVVVLLHVPWVQHVYDGVHVGVGVGVNA